VATMASGRETWGEGKHRTEATEVTEGDWGWWTKFYQEHRDARAGEK
jgi:hypothetical protein